MDFERYAAVYKALGDATRLEIIKMLKGGAMCACKILERFDITQPTLSYHMKILQACGLVEALKQGTWIHYSLNMNVLDESVEFLHGRVS